MAKIKIMPDNRDLSKPKHVPATHTNELNGVVPRFRPPGGKPPLPIQESYNRQGLK